MNISHLIEKRVTVVQYTESGSCTIVDGKLLKTTDGDFIVFTDSLFVSMIKRLFLKSAKDSFIKFPWSAVSTCENNLICIFDISEERLVALTEKYGMHNNSTA